VPTLVVGGEYDPLLPRNAGIALASMLGAEHVEIPGAGHWPLLPPCWRSTVGIVHRWLVHRLGEPLLDLYAEAMADREPDE
jgi:pimeloyl-ACP methyl ester carboxylesterase